MTTCLKAQTKLAARRCLPAPLRARALDIGREVLERLSDRSRVIEMATAARSVYPNHTRPAWVSVGPATGEPGLALAFGFLMQIEPDARWDEHAHAFLAPVVTKVAEEPLQPLGLGVGTAGLAFTVRLLSLGGRRHRKILAYLDDCIVTRTRHVLQHVPEDGGVHSELYDAVYGLAGIGRYLLRAAPTNPAAEDVVRRLLNTFVRWSEASFPTGFYTPPGKAHSFEIAEVPAKRHGYLTLGLAHGIPGPLALFALAHEAGLDIAGMREAAHALVERICLEVRQSPWGSDVPYHYFVASNPQRQGTWSRSAWCYGNPGVARALQLAACAFKVAAWREQADALMYSAIARPEKVMRLHSPTFCHGRAGLAQLLLRFLDDHHDPDPLFEQALETQLRHLLDAFDPHTPFGYRNIEPGTEPSDNPGLLSGAAGVALVLLSAGSTLAPAWDEVVLVS